MGRFLSIQKGDWRLLVRTSRRVSASGGEAASFTRGCYNPTSATAAFTSSPAWAECPGTASDPAVRVACFEMLRNLLSSLPEHWSASLLPDHQPQLEVETSVDLPITVINLVTELTLFLLVLSPYLDLMDQAGVGLVTTQPVSPCPT